jgi:hypothetical protein
MRKALLILAAAAPLAPAFPAAAQPPTQTNAQRAAAAAEEAATAAEAAARAARAAADAARRQVDGVSPEAARGAPVSAADDENVQSLIATATLEPETRRWAQSKMISSSVVNGPNYRAAKVTQEPDFQLIASDDKKVASIAWTLDISGAATGDRLVSTFFNVTASAPLAKSGDTPFGDLNGLADGTEVKLSFVQYRSSFVPQDLDEIVLKRATQACLKKRTGSEAEVTKACTPSKFPTGASEFVRTYDPADLDRFVNAVLPGGVLYYGLEGKASETSYHYLDRPSFATKDVSKFAYGATVFGGYVFNGGHTSLGASLGVTRRYKAHDDITLCQTVNAIPQSQCITAADGAPVRKTSTIATIELRQAFASPGRTPSFAIAPQFSYDATSGGYGVDLPVYLVSDGAGKLRGGLRLSYTNVKKAGGGRKGDTSLGLFVGVPFSVFR